MSEIQEACDTIERLNKELQDLVVRGLQVCGPQHLAPLRGLHAELARIGAQHVADRLQQLISAIEAGTSAAAAELLSTQATLRVFERVLTLRYAAAVLRWPSPDGGLENRDDDPSELAEIGDGQEGESHE